MDLGERTIKKVKWRLLPFLLLLYVINIIDRINLGFAALNMNKDLGITSVMYGSLAAAFFIGYFFFEVPSNMLMTKAGPNKWMSRIMVSWGLVTMAMFFVANFSHVYIARVALGICEAGFFPGIIYYLTFWFPAKERAQATSLFFLAMPIAQVFGSPLAVWLMENVQWFGYPGWRWLFMLEGLPAVILGIACWFYMTTSPQQATWLKQEEKDWLENKLQSEKTTNIPHGKHTFTEGFKSLNAWWLGAIYFFLCVAYNSTSVWMPQIIKSFSVGMTNTMVGRIMMLPYIVGALGMVFWSRHSDRTGERKWHCAIPTLVMALGFITMILSTTLTMKVVGVIFQGMSIIFFFGPFWALPGRYLSANAAAVGVAIINSLSSAAGFIGNILTGYIHGSSFGLKGVFIFLMSMCLISTVLILAMPMKDIALLQDVKGEKAVL